MYWINHVGELEQTSLAELTLMEYEFEKYETNKNRFFYEEYFNPSYMQQQLQKSGIDPLSAFILDYRKRIEIIGKLAGNEVSSVLNLPWDSMTEDDSFEIALSYLQSLPRASINLIVDKETESTEENERLKREACKSQAVREILDLDISHFQNAGLIFSSATAKAEKAIKYLRIVNESDSEAILLDRPVLEKVEILDWGRLDIDSLVKLLPQCTKLQVLMIENYLNHKDEEKTLSIPNNAILFPSVKILLIEGYTVKQGELSKLLKWFPNLTQLKIYDCRYSVKGKETASWRPVKLSLLKIMGAHFHAPFLLDDKTLRNVECNMHANSYPIIQFVNVTHLTMSSSEPGNNNITMLVERYPNVTHLMIRAIDDVSDELLKFKHLQKIYFTCTDGGKKAELFRKKYELTYARKLSMVGSHSEEKSRLQKQNNQSTFGARLDTYSDKQGVLVAETVLMGHEGPVHPAYYRLNVCDKFDLSYARPYFCVDDIQVIEPVYHNHLAAFFKEDSNKNNFLGQKKIILDVVNQWQPLYTLTRDNILTVQKTNRLKSIQFGRKDSTGQLYIRSSAAQELDLIYMLTLYSAYTYCDVKSDDSRAVMNSQLLCDIRFEKDGKLQNNVALRDFLQLSFPDKMNAFICFGRAFRNGKLILPVLHTVYDKYNAFIQHQFGVCRHSSNMVCALATALGLGGMVAYQENDIHANIESLDERGQWVKYNVVGINAVSPENIIVPFQLNESIDEDPTPEKKRLRSEEDVGKDGDNPYLLPILPNALNANEFLTNLFGLLRLKETRNVCLRVRTASDILYWQKALSIYCKQHELNYHYVPSLDAINSSALHLNAECVEFDIDKYRVPSELMQRLPHLKVLAVNWHDYAEKHVGQNKIISKSRRIAEGDINQETIVINFVLNETMFSVDFFRRQILIHVPYFNFEEGIRSSLLIEKRIDLTGVSNWRAVLLDHIEFEGERMRLVPGELQLALTKNETHLTLINPPHDEELERFVHDLNLTKTCFYNGESHSFPSTFGLSVASENVITSDCYPAHNWLGYFDYELNDETYDFFFKTATCAENGWCERPGIFEQHQHTSLNILVSENLSLEKWARLVRVAKEHQVVLHFQFVVEVKLPFQTHHIAFPTMPPSGQLQILVHRDMSLLSHYAISHYQATYPAVTVTPTMQFSDIFGHLIKHNNKKTVFSFEYGELFLRLKQGETIILRGSFSQDCLDRLHSMVSCYPYLWINGKREVITGRLIILIDSTQDMSPIFAPVLCDLNKVNIHYRDNLHEAYPAETVNIAKFSVICPRISQYFKKALQFADYEKLMLNAIKRPDKNPFKPLFLVESNIQGLEESKRLWRLANVNKVPATIEIGTSETDVNQRRLNKLFRAFSRNRCVLLIGETGNGKSYLLEALAKMPDIVLINGDVNLGDYLKPVLPKQKKIVVWDEGTLGLPRRFDGLYDLQNQTPGLFFDLAYRGINEDCYFLIIGNPANKQYANRCQDRFFQQVPEVISFKELPDQYIYQFVLMPALGGNYQAARFFLLYYHEVRKANPSKCFTLRNLNMMIQRYNCYQDVANGKVYWQQLALYALYQEIKYSIPDFAKGIKALFHKNVLKTFKARFYDDHAVLRAPSFLYTRFTKKVRRTIIELIKMRAKTDKLCGLLLEGPSGIGKSDMVISILNEMGVPYFLMTPADFVNNEKAMTIKIKNALSDKKALVIDELNSLPIALQKLLNELMFKDSLVFATQNPSYFVGRSELYQDLLNRFQPIIMPNYTLEELNHMLRTLGLSEAAAKAQMKWYSEALSSNPLQTTPANLLEHVRKL